MRTIALVTAATLAALTTANAEFKNTPPQQVNDLTYLECVPVRSTESVYHDRDPVYKTQVSLTLENHSSPTAIYVGHTTMSGSDYDRSDQYNHAAIWQTPHKNQWFWKGYRGDLTMVGEIKRDITNEWWYGEQIFGPNGGLRFAMAEKCHQVNDGADERRMSREDEAGKNRTPPTMQDAPRWLGR
jgi:hypothetical protein